MEEITASTKYGPHVCKILDAGNASEIKPYQKELEKTRSEDVGSVMKSVTKVRGDLENLKAEICNNFTSDNQDHFKRRLFDMEGKIKLVKESINKELMKLMIDETELMKELQLLERRIKDWEKPLNPQILKPHKQSSYKIPARSDNPVDEFQNFVSSSGGHTGHWHEQDHLLFLRERKKYKGEEKFLSAVHFLLPDITYEQIAEHEKWYQKYEFLKNCRKEAIKKWKSEKAKQQQDKEETKEEKKSINNKKICPQGNIVERIKEWKKQQMMKKLEEEEKQKKEKEKLKEEERKKKEMQEIKKSMVNQYKAEKLAKLRDEISSLGEQIESQNIIAKKMLLKEFRLQDVKFIEKKKMIRLQMEAKSERLKLTKPAIEVILKRNPQRIFQPTVTWTQHCLESQKKEKFDPVFDLNMIPRLAVAEWRRNLT